MAVNSGLIDGWSDSQRLEKLRVTHNDGKAGPRNPAGLKVQGGWRNSVGETLSGPWGGQTALTAPRPGAPWLASRRLPHITRRQWVAIPRRGAAALWPISGWGVWGQDPQGPTRLSTAGRPWYIMIPFAAVLQNRSVIANGQSFGLS